ncbi:MAG: hypothetical protein IT376_05985 [Polyangiaceae bacterium]|nr:hypothetical protein [Polyangiaceae bacterium]
MRRGRGSRAAARSVAVAAAGAGLAAACGGPPPSRFPDAESALGRLRATAECSRGVRAEAKIDYIGERGRVRGTVHYLAASPESLRFDVVSPFGATVVRLASDGERFTLLDALQKTFLHGRASACNVARFTQLPVPPFALVQLLRGDAPVLVHAPASASLEWDAGAYAVRIPSRHAATEHLRLVPHPEDWEKPWAEQRVRLLRVQVDQAGVEAYHVELADHSPVETAAAIVDEEGLEPDVPPSGPACRAEVPRSLRFVVPWKERDLVLKATEIEHNPPLLPGTFRERRPGGVRAVEAVCTD